jgi:hypothetical protein
MQQETDTRPGQSSGLPRLPQAKGASVQAPMFGTSSRAPSLLKPKTKVALIGTAKGNPKAQAAKARNRRPLGTSITRQEFQQTKKQFVQQEFQDKGKDSAFPNGLSWFPKPVIFRASAQLASIFFVPLISPQKWLKLAG